MCSITGQFYLLTTFEVHLKDSQISSILISFGELLPQLLADFFQKVLLVSCNIKFFVLLQYMSY